MNLKRVQDELYGVLPESECCIRAELTAFLRGHSRLRITSTGSELEVYACRAQLARRIYMLFSSIEEVDAEIRLKRNPHSYKRQVYLIEFRKIDISQFGLLPGEARLRRDKAVLSSTCCSRAYLRGAFLRSGSINITERKGYHLEIAPLEEDEAAYLKKLASKQGLELGQYTRKNSTVLYSKSGGGLSTFMKLTGAYSSLLKFEDIRACRETRGNINRTINFETANLERTVRVAGAQVIAIKKIKKAGMMDKLTPELRMVAELRVSFPYDDLNSLAGRVTPPITKSGVRYRLKRIMDISAEIEHELSDKKYRREVK